jgi:type III pantothenate kinase
MNWLLLDCGNSMLKWAVVPAPISSAASPPAALQLLAEGVQPLDQPGWAAQLGRSWRAPEFAALGAVHGCAVGTAADRAAIAGVVRQIAAVPLTWHGPAARFEAGALQLVNGYRDPLQLGADRWHALIAARQAHPARALMVVSAGTATTIDSLTAAGRFDGGVIAPGLRMMLTSLARGTAGLPLLGALPAPLLAEPDNTAAAIAAGVLDAQLGLIERRVRAAAARHGSALLLLLGGGAAPSLLPGLESSLTPGGKPGAAVAAIVIEHNLVLRGVLLRASHPSPANV